MDTGGQGQEGGVGYKRSMGEKKEKYIIKYIYKKKVILILRNCFGGAVRVFISSFRNVLHVVRKKFLLKSNFLTSLTIA